MAARGQRILYQEAADAIRRQITSGELAPGKPVGSSLPSLARQYQVGIGTMRAALAVLSDEGLVETIPGKGTFVLAAVPGAAPQDIRMLSEQVAELRTEVKALSQRVSDPPELTETLGRIEGNLVELYDKTGNEYPWEDLPGGARRSRAADEKDDSREQRA